MLGKSLLKMSLFFRDKVGFKRLTLAHTIVDDGVRTRGANGVVKINAVFIRPPLNPVPIEPENCRVVILDQLQDLIFLVGDVPLLVFTITAIAQIRTSPAPVRSILL